MQNARGWARVRISESAAEYSIKHNGSVPACACAHEPRVNNPRAENVVRVSQNYFYSKYVSCEVDRLGNRYSDFEDDFRKNSKDIIGGKRILPVLRGSAASHAASRSGAGSRFFLCSGFPVQNKVINAIIVMFAIRQCACSMSCNVDRS